MSVYVTRPANAGNHPLEVLQDASGKPMTFKDEDQAIAYLFVQGIVIDDDDLIELEFPSTCPIVIQPLAKKK